MSLVLEIEFLTGVYRGTSSPASKAPDWPPQPDRIFSALVSAWASRGESTAERDALEWLEKTQVPIVCASDCSVRPAPACYVPPNDFRSPQRELSDLKWYRDFLACGKKPTKKGGYRNSWQQALSTFPDYRQRKERRFPTARPDDPTMMIVWSDDPGSNRYKALTDIARDVAYLGHSASLVRCRFFMGDLRDASHPGVRAQRRVYPGRLAELEVAHRANPVRPVIEPGASVLTDPLTLGSESSTEWLVLEAIEGTVPDVRASALVCRALRRTLMSGYRRAGSGDAIPEIVSGHTPDLRPTKHPHLAVVPMPFVGYPHADGRVFGFALVPPSGMDLQDVPGLVQAFEAVAPYDPGRERRVLRLKGIPLTESLALAPSDGTTARSLSPNPYLEPARTWASVTPIVLDRHLKGKHDAEIRQIIANSCENVGLPRPDPDWIQTSKYSAVKGAASARPAAGTPPWTRWRVPESLATRSLVHAVVDFGRRTEGPVLLGAGRFTGLGLCRGVGG